MLMEDGTPLTEENKYDIPVVEDLVGAFVEEAQDRMIRASTTA
jgi:hypothetical protein